MSFPLATLHVMEDINPSLNDLSNDAENVNDTFEQNNLEQSIHGFNNDVSNDTPNNVTSLSFAVSIEVLKTRNEHMKIVMSQQVDHIRSMRNSIVYSFNKLLKYYEVLREFTIIRDDINSFDEELNTQNESIDYLNNKSNALRVKFYETLEISQSIFDDESDDDTEEDTSSEPNTSNEQKQAEISGQHEQDNDDDIEHEDAEQEVDNEEDDNDEQEVDNEEDEDVGITVDADRESRFLAILNHANRSSHYVAVGSGRRVSENPPRPIRDNVLNNPVYIDEQSDTPGIHGIYEYKDSISCPKPSGRDVEATPIILRCVICHTNQSSTIIFPCMHVAMCDECSAQLIKVSNVCPMCRSGIFQICRVYLAAKKYVPDTNTNDSVNNVESSILGKRESSGSSSSSSSETVDDSSGSNVEHKKRKT